MGGLHIVRTALALAPLLAAGAGCNQLLGLDETQQTRDPDAALVDAVQIDAPPAIDAACIPGTTHNEDSDSFFDDCDNCPHIYQGGTQPDRDADGVGDECDPRDGDADRLLFFHSFESAPAYDPLLGNGTTGVWAVAAGRLALNSGELGVHYLARFAAGEENITVATQVTVTAVPPGIAPGIRRAVGVWAAIDTTRTPSPRPTGMLLELSEQITAASMPRHAAQIVDTAVPGPIPPVEIVDSTMWAVEEPYQLTFTCDARGLNPQCSGRVGRDGVSTPIGPWSSAGTRPGAIGLGVQGASASFDYLAVYVGAR